MKFVVDESVDQICISILRKEEYEVLSIAKEKLGISDDEVFQIAVNNKAILLTEDKDFGELAI
tara:strand:+ start:5328 stop:5516 length:189 start_codon:yes stop_codon:yes gene_type:complete